MNRMHVRLASSSVAILIIAAMALFGWHEAGCRSQKNRAVPADAAEPGAALFQNHCTACHSSAKLAEMISKAPDRPTRLAEITRFLKSHGDASPEEDRQIVSYLGSLRP
jgi:mono/diheme cytochrome c family protein